MWNKNTSVESSQITQKLVATTAECVCSRNLSISDRRNVRVLKKCHRTDLRDCPRSTSAISSHPPPIVTDILYSKETNYY